MNKKAKPSGISLSNSPPYPIMAQQAPQPISMNDVIQKVLLHYQSLIARGDLVVRCEALPAVIGEENKLVHAFDKLFSGIINDSRAGLRQYLHIACIEQDSEVMDLTTPSGFKNYLIEFRTNLRCVASDPEQETLNELKSEMQQNSALLEVSVTEAENCLYRVLISGKL